MRLAIRVLIASVAIPLSIADAQTSVCSRLFVRNDNELWLAGDDGRRQKLHDPFGVRQPHYSPDGSQIVYAHASAATAGKLPSIGIVNAGDGTAVKFLSLPELPVNAILNIGWRTGKRVWFEGHHNPSLSFYYEIDVASGEISVETPGGGFSPSPEGKHLIWEQWEPHFAKHCDCIEVLLDGKYVYASPKNEKHRQISDFHWSPDGQHCAFVDELFADDETSRDVGYSLIVLSVGGKQRAPIRLPSLPRKIEWRSDQTIVLSADRSVEIDLKTGVVSEAKDGTAKESIVTVGAERFTIEDQRCSPAAASPPPRPGGHKSE